MKKIKRPKMVYEVDVNYDATFLFYFVSLKDAESFRDWAHWREKFHYRPARISRKPWRRSIQTKTVEEAQKVWEICR